MTNFVDQKWIKTIRTFTECKASREIIGPALTNSTAADSQLLNLSSLRFPSNYFISTFSPLQRKEETYSRELRNVEGSDKKFSN